MQEKIIEELRKELKDQIEENKELLKINEEHKKINGELRKENDGLVTVIDLVKEFIFSHSIEYKPHFRKISLNTADCNEILEILERVNEE